MRSRIWTAAVLALVASRSWSQQMPGNAEAKPAYVPRFVFDVASIRESPPAASYTVSDVNPEHESAVSFQNFSLPNLLVMAYGVDWAQISGLPDWARRAMFNIQAMSDRSVDIELMKLGDQQARLEKRHMLQALLADRFQLKVHWETRQSNVYDLVVTKSGSKLHPGGSMPPSVDERKNFVETEIPQIYQRGDGQRGYEFIGHGCSVELLAQELTGQMGVPVRNRTGLTGTYDFVLQYHGTAPDDRNDDPAVWPALTTAVPDQLGLKMMPSKGDRQFLVIDHMDRPSQN